MFLALIFVLSAADIATTAYALKRGAKEANPIARWLFKVIGHPLAAMIVTKLVLVSPMVAFSISYPNWWAVPAIYCASLVWVVTHNLRVIRGL